MLRHILLLAMICFSFVLFGQSQEVIASTTICELESEILISASGPVTPNTNIISLSVSNNSTVEREFDLPPTVITLNSGGTISNITAAAITDVNIDVGETRIIELGTFNSTACEPTYVSLNFTIRSTDSLIDGCDKFTVDLSGVYTLSTVIPGGILDVSSGCGLYTFSESLPGDLLTFTTPLWSFGDGTQSSEQSPSHTYSNNGVYVVSLQDGSGENCDTYFIALTVTGLSEAEFSYTSDCLTNTVTFTGLGGTGDYLWDFGDGQTSTLADPTHVYNGPGTYTVSYSLSGNNICASDYISTIVVGNITPYFSISSVCEGSSLQISYLTTGVDSYSWNWDSPGTSDLSTGYQTSHLYTGLDFGTELSLTKTIELTTERAGCLPQTITKQAVIYKNIPALFTSEVSVCDANAYTHSVSTPQAGVDYVWTGSLGSSTDLDYQAEYSIAGTNSISLTASNGACVNSSTSSLTVEEGFAVTITSPSDVICGAGSLLLTGYLANSPSGANYTYVWTNSQGVEVGYEPSYLATASGEYSLEVTAVDCDSVSANASKTISILELPSTIAVTDMIGVDCPGLFTGEVNLSIPDYLSASGYTVNGGLVSNESTYNLSGLPALESSYVIAYAEYPSCSYTGVVDIASTAPTVSVTTELSNCTNNTGSLTAVLNGNVSGAVSYSWTNFLDPETELNTSDTYLSVGPGIYNLNVVVGNCELTSLGHQVLTPNLTVNHTGSYICDGTETEVVFTGITEGISSENYSYSIPSETVTGSSIFLAAGSYSVTAVGETSGCSRVYDFEVSMFESLSLDFETEGANCYTGLGSGLLIVLGGSGNYEYAWEDGIDNNSPFLVDQQAGNYVVTVTDLVSSCFSEETITIPSPEPLAIEQALINGCEATGIIDINSPGVAPYVYTWLDNSSDYSYTSTSSLLDYTVEGLFASDNYTLTVTDANGCTDSQVAQGTMNTQPVMGLQFRFVFLDTDFEIIEDPKKEYDDVIAEATAELADAIDQQVSSCISSQESESSLSYSLGCLKNDNLGDVLKFNYTIEYEQYMLYYYDRAGNLTKTVPPEGVDFLTSAEIQSIQAYRKELIPAEDVSLWVPEHRLATTYEYNALSQLKSQSTPDGAESKFIYDGLQRLRFSQNARQKLEGTYSFMKYDALGRVIEAGEALQSIGSQNLTLDFDNLFSDNNTRLSNESDYPVSNTGYQLVKTHYNTVTSTTYYGESQTFLQNRISYIERDEDGDASTLSNRSVTYYSYDVHGNVKWLVQEDPIIGKNYIKYSYDLISGNVLEVVYNENRSDKYYHRYDYDENNRLLVVETSRDGEIWDRDAGYSYYKHGPLQKVQIGDDQIQESEYVYTISGWLKGINNPNTIATNVSNTTEGISNVSSTVGASDYGYLSSAFGMSLGYYQGDFERTDANNPYANLSNSNRYTLASNGQENNLYNGNISSWSWKTATGNDKSKHLTMSYQYDNLQRIKSVDAYEFDNSTGNHNQPQLTAFKASYDFDRNGNLEHLRRHDSEGVLMDDLSYDYSAQQDTEGNKLTNQLQAVADAVGTSTTTGGRGDFVEAHTYTYDAIGNLTRDSGKELLMLADGSYALHDVVLDISWTVDQKLSKITKTVTPEGLDPAMSGVQSEISFQYDAMGVRIGKQSISDLSQAGATSKHTRYVLDAQGNTMAVYEIAVTDSEDAQFDYKAILSLNERPIYGASRLGVDNEFIELQTWYFNAGDQNIPAYTYADNGVEIISELRNWISPLLRSNETASGDLCNCSIRHTSFEDDGSGSINLVDKGELVNYYGYTGNGIAVGESQEGELSVYATIAEGYAGNEAPITLLFNGENKLIKGVENLPTPLSSVKPIIGKGPEGLSSSTYQLFIVDESGHPSMHVIDLEATGFGTTSPEGEVISSTLLDDAYTYGSHMALIEDGLNARNLLYATRYLAATNEGCLGETELVVFEVTATGVSEAIYLTRVESGDALGEGEIQLSKDARELMYYNRLNRIGGFGHRDVAINIFGLSDNYTTISTATTTLIEDDYLAGNYGKGALDFEGNGNLHYSTNGVYEENIGGSLNEGSSKQIRYYDRTNQTFAYLSAPGTYSYRSIRRGLNNISYVPTETELNEYEAWLGATEASANGLLIGLDPILESTQGYQLSSYLPSQPHRIFERQNSDYKRKVGNKHYELSDHLGNVRYVIGDARILEGIAVNSSGDGYEIATTDQQIMWSDYYPYGMYLDGRHEVKEDKYRYGFQGQETDDEIKGEGNSYGYEARFYDSRVGRWLSADPVAHPHLSPYNAIDNNPIIYIDPDGKDVIIVIYAGSDARYKQAAWTRVREVRNRPTFDKTTDKVIFMKVADLGTLEDKISTQLSDRVKKKYGKTVEFSYYGHGAPDGPVGEFSTSGKHNLSNETNREIDRSQMTKEGWAQIDFNFDSEHSIANFYGCQTAKFAMMFAVFQDVAFASGYGGKAGPTTNPTSFEGSWQTYDQMWMWDGDGLIIYGGRGPGEHQTYDDADGDGYLDWEKNDPTSSRDWDLYFDSMKSMEYSSGEFSTNVRVRSDGKMVGYEKK